MSESELLSIASEPSISTDSLLQILGFLGVLLLFALFALYAKRDSKN